MEIRLFTKYLTFLLISLVFISTIQAQSASSIWSKDFEMSDSLDDYISTIVHFRSN